MSLEIRPFRLFQKLPLYLLKLRLTAKNRPGYVILTLTFFLAMASSIFLALYLTATFVLTSIGIHPDAPSKICRAYQTIFPPENAEAWLKQTIQTKHDKSGEIPKIIHQISWHPDVSGDFLRKIAKWKTDKKYHYRIWTRNDLRILLTEKYPQYLQLFDVLGDELLLAPFILHHYGGIFIDLRLEPTGSLDQFLMNGKCITSRIPQLYSLILYKSDVTVTSLFMASVPRHPFLEYLLLLLPTQDTSKCPQVEKRTAPVLQNVLSSYKTTLKNTADVSEEFAVKTIPSNNDVVNWSDVNIILRQKAEKKCRHINRHFGWKSEEDKKIPCEYLNKHNL